MDNLDNVTDNVTNIEQPIQNTTKSNTTFKQFLHKHKKALIIITIILLVAIFSFNFSVLLVSGESMEPTLHNGTILFGRKTFMSLDRFDVVVCYNDNHSPIIKRIIGLPNETIEYKDNKLYINDELIEENYSIGNTEDFKVQLGKDNYYCLGDNRENSRDSRSIGQIPKENIIAEVLF